MPVKNPNNEDDSIVVNIVFGLLAIIAGVLMLILCCAGCSTTPTARKKAEVTEAQLYDQRIANDDALFSGYETDATTLNTARLDLELKADIAAAQVRVANVQAMATANPTNASVQATAQADVIGLPVEIARLTRLHDDKIAQFAAAQRNMRALQSQNAQVHDTAAHQIRDALNPPPVTAPLSLTTQINAATGVTPAPTLNQAAPAAPGK